MKISAQMVKELRELTGAGILEAKKALEAASGDFDQAAEQLRAKGIKRAEERADREATEGIVELYAHPGNRVGVMLELNCETDFVARTDAFRELAHDLALHIAALAPRFVAQEDVPAEVVESKSAEFQAEARAGGKPDDIVAKIVQGRLSKFYDESCLMQQPFVKDEDITIEDLILETMRKTGENVRVRRFDRYELGESL